MTLELWARKFIAYSKLGELFFWNVEENGVERNADNEVCLVKS